MFGGGKKEGLEDLEEKPNEEKEAQNQAEAENAMADIIEFGEAEVAEEKEDIFSAKEEEEEDATPLTTEEMIAKEVLLYEHRFVYHTHTHTHTHTLSCMSCNFRKQKWQ